MMKEAHILGTGSYVPERVLTNTELESLVDTNDEWIISRTGIRERRIAAEGETTSMMGLAAARRALAEAGVDGKQVGMIVVATSTPDMIFPSTACLIQEGLGAEAAFCMDLSAACSGFLFALDCARRYVQCGAVEYALVVGAEKMSMLINWEDRGTCILFGDGAGAAVVGQARPGSGQIVNLKLGSNGTLNGLLTVPAGGSARPASFETVQNHEHAVVMAGREVFKHAVHGMSEAAREVLSISGRTIDNVSCIIPHQANLRIISAIGKQLHVDDERFFVNLDKYGNTSAASVILALDEARKSGRVQVGDTVLLVVFGGGFTWGAGLLEWKI